MNKIELENLSKFAKKHNTELVPSEKKFLTGDKQKVILNLKQDGIEYLLVYEKIRSFTASYHNQTTSISLSQKNSSFSDDTKHIIKRSNSILNLFIPTAGKIKCFPKNDSLKNKILNTFIKDMFNEHNLEIIIGKNEIELKIKNLKTLDEHLLEKLLKGIKSIFNAINTFQYSK